MHVEPFLKVHDLAAIITFLLTSPIDMDPNLVSTRNLKRLLRFPFVALLHLFIMEQQLHLLPAVSGDDLVLVGSWCESHYVALKGMDMVR